MKDGLNKWKDIHIHWLEDSFIKLATLPKLTYSCKTPYQNSSLSLWRNWQEIDPKIHTEIQGTQNIQSNLEKEQNQKTRALLASLDERRMVWGRMDTYICMAESLHCSPETTTTLLISYTPI